MKQRMVLDSFSIDPEVRDKFSRWSKVNGFKSKSEAIRHAICRLMFDENSSKNDKDSEQVPALIS